MKLKKSFQKHFRWLIKHSLTVFSCVLIIVLGIAALTYADPVTTTIGENISTNSLTATGLIVNGNATTTGDLDVAGDTTLATTTLSGDLDLSGNELKNSILEKLADFPSSPAEGQMFYNTAFDTPYWYTGSQWKGDVSGATFVVAASDSLNKEKADYICDGTADEVQIQAAIDALPSGGGKVLLMEGAYAMNGDISIPDYVSIVGSGSGTLINFDVIQDRGFRNEDLINGNHNIIIADMKIDGMDKTNDPIEFVNSYNCQFMNLEITQGVHDGLELQGSYDCIINNVIAHDSLTYHGIELDDGSYNNIISNCIVYNNPSSGIVIDGTSHDNLITGCVSRDNTGYGIALYSNSYDNIVTSNIAEGNSLEHFFDSGTENLVMAEKDGKLGIGTANPSAKLEVAGDLNLSGSSSELFVYGTGNSFFMGSIGIGTASPQHKFDVIGSGGVAYFGSADDGILFQGSTGKIVGINQASNVYNDLEIRAGASGSGITVKTSGNVGIGTTEPVAKLNILGGTDSSAARDVLFLENVNTRGWMVTIGNNVLADEGGYYPIVFEQQTGGNAGDFIVKGHRNTIFSTGNVGIATTSPATKLDVNGIIKTQPASSRTCNADAQGGIMYDSDDNHFYGCNGSAWVQLDN